MLITPRPYQTRDIDLIRDAYRRKVRRVLYVSACGSGKTVTFTKIAQGAAAKNKKVTVVAHRKELISQCSDKLSRFGVDHGIIKAGYEPEYDKNIQVASIQTLYRRDGVTDPDLFIYDECHHSPAKNAQGVLGRHPNALLLGVTASPVWGKQTLGGYYDEMIIGPTVKELVRDGYLVDTMVFAPPPVCDLEGVDYENLSELEERMNKRRITGDAIAHYERIARGMAAIVYVVNVKHAYAVAEQFRESGHNFWAIEGESEDRDELLRKFSTGEVTGLVSCDLISEGTDVPRARVAIKLRPTKSLVLNIQQDGRINRPFYAAGPLDTIEQRLAAIAASEKPYAISIDHVANYFFHGWPDSEFEWSLTIAPRRKDLGAAFAVNQCISCYRVYRGDECPYCHADREIKTRKVLYTDGDLKQMKKDEITLQAQIKKNKKEATAARKKEAERLKIIKNRERKDAKTVEQLTIFAIKYGYEYPEQWAERWHKLRSKHGARRN